MLKEKSIQSTRGKFYYWTNDEMISSNVCLVLCHGLTADHSLFDMQISAFSNTNKMILLDIPLHGKSIPYQNFTFQNIVSDLKKIIDKESIDKIVFIGQSAGGYIAQAFIDRYPNDVVGFIGIGTTPFGNHYYKKSELFWVKHFTTIAKLYPYSYYCKASSKSTAITEAAQKNMHNTLTKLGKAGMIKAANAIYGEFLKVQNPVNYSFPVLLTYGEFDNVGLVKKYNQQWAKNDNFELKVIENASHNANYDNFEEFNELVKQYLIKIK